MSSSAANIRNDQELRIVLVGKTGVGKSATGNTILGRECFITDFSPKSVTTYSDKDRATVDGQQVAVVDTPGLTDSRCDEKQTQKALNLINFAAPGPHIFLVVVSLLGRFTDEEIKAAQMIQKIFGEAANRYSMVLFTNGDLLPTPIEEYFSKSEELKELVARCNGEYHVFNNKLKDRAQVTELMKKIRNIMERNGGSHYTTEMFQEAERVIEEEKRKQKFHSEDVGGRALKHTEVGHIPHSRFSSVTGPDANMNSSKEKIRNGEELRIVLVGKTGVGKSATRNTILGRECFKSVTTHCDKDSTTVDGQQVAVVDTPGLFYRRCGEKQTLKALNLCINLASPGPHIFLVVVSLGRFIDEEIKALQRIQEIFGEAADRYSMVLFTHGDFLRTDIKEYLSKSEELQRLVARCNGEYHVFNNKLKDRTQVTELLGKIRNIVEKNGGSHYITEMFQDAEKKVLSSVDWSYCVIL